MSFTLFLLLAIYLLEHRPH